MQSKIDSLLEGDDCEIHLLTDITDKVDTLLVDILRDKTILDGLSAGVEEGARAHNMVVRFDDVKLQVQSRVRQYQSASVTCASPAGSLTSVASVSNGQTLQQPQQGGAAATMPAKGCSSAPPDGGAVTISVPGPSDQVFGSGVQSSVAFMTPANESSLTTQGAFVSSAATHVVYSSGLQQSAAHWTPPALGYGGNTSSPQWASPGYSSYASPSRSHTSSSSTVHTKKPALPTFSGDRSDWSEFKYVWKSLAEKQFEDKVLLAYELKKSCAKGKAADSIKHIAVTSEFVYDEMWARLSEEYDDQGLNVQSALYRLMSLKAVDERDYKGIVKFVDTVGGVHHQLRELHQLEAISMVDVDRISDLLPHSMHVEWMRRYKDLTASEKIRPIMEFVRFLKNERSYMARLAESSVVSKKHPDTRRPQKHAAGSHTVSGSPAKNVSGTCVVHENSHNHKTEDCFAFKKMSVESREAAVRKARRCFKCFQQHFKKDCKSNSHVCQCGRDHHPLLCRGVVKEEVTRESTNTAEAEEKTQETVKVGTSLVNAGTMALYPINKAYIAGQSAPIMALMDAGSNASYIKESCAQRFRLRRVDKVTLDVTTVGGEQKEYDSTVYEVPLRISDTRVRKLLVYGLREITGPLSALDVEVLRKLFPESDPNALTRPSRTVDLLIGTDYFGLHPKTEVARAGENLSIMEGYLGACLVGTHPLLKEETLLKQDVPRRLNSSLCRVSTFNIQTSRVSHPAFSRPDSFILGEELGVESVPKCGGCKCGHCPIPGHDLSFKEEQELHLIRDNLRYDSEKQLWQTSYPWLVNPETLPDNYTSAAATLRSTEKSLSRDPSWATSYSEQIQDMVDRGAARKLSEDEICTWKGPIFYISHLAVSNPKSKSTPVRIVFNSSQTWQGVSLNGCLAKGPDSYRNSVLAILLRWREEAEALVGDIRKMFHSVHLEQLEQHCHRFLWRELDPSREPEVYVMTRVNMGDRPAPAIATEALFMTAEMNKETLPQAASFIQTSSFVDDLVDSVSSGATELARDAESVLRSGGFEIKCWQMSGETGSANGAASELKGEGECTGVLGVVWNHIHDTMSYKVSLNFSKRRRGAKTEPDIGRDQIPEAIPHHLTRRIVLQQVMAIFDPMGLVSSFTLIAKVYLRETWRLKLDWDDPLPGHMHQKWVEYFTTMFQMEYLSFPRCLRPENAVGPPWLLILSDGSDTAYGCAAYVRWRCQDGSIILRLVMAKSRIAPLDKVSTPRMELNGAILSKRCRVAIQKEMRYTFERVLHLVDSETVLNMLHKTSCRFKVYEGVRVGEIQAAMKGDLSEWAWIPGEDNTADWLTRGRMPKDLDADSEWFQGPKMLRQPFEDWNIRFGKTSDDPVPGEKRLVVSHAAKQKTTLLRYERFSSFRKMVRVTARLVGIAKERSFRGGCTGCLSTERLKQAEELLIKEVQDTLDMTSADYRSLNTAQMANGLWVVGAHRLARFNPMGAIHSELPLFLPKGHPLTALAMKQAHEAGHRGRDATLAAFRARFWTSRASRLAGSIRNQCLWCRKRDAKATKQHMGALPEDRLRPSPPFSHTMVDLFGPYTIRGEVQKRTSGKAWGMIFTDLCSRAVHIEAMFGYDANSALLALSRFASVRGWPERIYSDPGSQLVAISKEINQAATKAGLDNGTHWIVGPADSPWRQGAVESLVKASKRALHFGLADHRLTAAEFLTVCAEAANTINERPLGLLPSLDSDINVLTPNCLLLGRTTAANPGAWQPEGISLKSRHNLVQTIGQQFWCHWIELVAPMLLRQHKWFGTHRNMEVGDVVLVADSNAVRGEYRLAVVTQTHPSQDGCVRSVTVSYKTHKVGESVRRYEGVPYTSVRRGVQRLALLVPVAQVDYEEDQQEITGAKMDDLAAEEWSWLMSSAGRQARDGRP